MHERKGEGKIDPSRRFLGGGGTHVGGRDDRHDPKGFVDGADWLDDAAGGELVPGSGSCNNIGPDNSGSRYGTPCGREKATNEVVEDGGAGRRHWFRRGTLDNRHRSCQDGSGCWSSVDRGRQ